MTPHLDETLDNRAETVRGELEKLRGEARKLQAEARLTADQHLNKIEDQIEKLRRDGKEKALSEAGEAISAGASRAWSDISEAMREVGRIIRREMDQQRADRP